MRADGRALVRRRVGGITNDTGGIEIKDGHIALPQGPGLGLTIDPDRFGAPVTSFGA